MIFTTARLIIRNYRPEDRPIFFAIAAKPAVRLFHTRVPDRADNDAFIDKQIATLDTIGCGYAVVERRADGAVVGDVGIRPVPDSMPFSGAVHFEIVRLLDPYPDGFVQEKRGRCFPAAHASGGFAMIASFFVLNRRAWRIAGLALGLGLAWIVRVVVDPLISRKSER